MELEAPAVVDTPRSRAACRFGFWVSFIVAALTVATFALALTALPNSVPYPFTSQVIMEQWPMDYLWMYPAMVLMLLFVALLGAIHQYSPPQRKTYSLLGLSFAIIAAAVLLTDYYLRVTVMQPSLLKGQLDAWSMLTQYNPNGVFIALEEMGYLLMSLSLLCAAAVFTGKSGLERGIRRLFTLSFAASIVALVVVSALLGIDRGTVFEIIVISIVWLTLIAGVVLTATVLGERRRRRPRPEGPEGPGLHLARGTGRPGAFPARQELRIPVLI